MLSSNRLNVVLKCCPANPKAPPLKKNCLDCNDVLKGNMGECKSHRQ